MHLSRARRVAQCGAVLAAILTATGWRSDAQPQADRVVTNPPRLNDAGKRMPPLLFGRGAVPSASSETVLDLNVTYTDGQIWNPATARYDRVRLRSYQGTRIDPQAPYVSPTLDVNPGDTIRVTLHNRLQADPTCEHHM